MNRLSSRRQNFVIVWIIEIAVFAVLIGGWYLITHESLMSPELLPAPGIVFTAVRSILSNSATRTDLLITLTQVIVAMAIVIPLAVSTGMLVGQNPNTTVFDSLANIGMTIPQPIFLPVLFIIFGSNVLEIVLFGITHAFFVIVINSASSTRSVPQSYHQLAHLYGARRRDLYRKIYFPFMVPVILQGVRLGLIFCVSGVMLAEMYSGNGGFGKDILYWGSSFVLPNLLAGIILVGISTVVLNGVFHIFEKRAGSWRES